MEKMKAEMKVDKKKLLMNIALRSILFIIVGMVPVFNQSANKTAEIAIIVILIALLVFALFPLVHLKDVLIYYDDKIVLGKKQITFNNPEEIQWSRQKMYFLGTRTRICNSVAAQRQSFMDFMLNSNMIDVTYMKDAKDTFIKCYLNQ
ncbi:MAG: hypothetical protein HFI44_13970 [Lachnospiraceae bacterium]|nr:hypothetical protein [Lachnospiraceae bacterium]GFI03277.1 hypothetical protein IMSAGC005_02109 [Lachnospiraceae bacterium]